MAASGAPQPVRLWEDASIFSCWGPDESAHARDGGDYELGRTSCASWAGDSCGVRVRDHHPTVVAAIPPSSRTVGVRERVYPVDDGRHQIDHVKLLIVDGKPRWAA
jgi:hypothetical protein